MLGWTPYVWLVYLSFFLVEPLAGGASPGEWIATAAVLAAFLPLYFWGYWLRGRRALVPARLILLLGVLLAPWNFGGSVFFVYAAASLAHAVPAREARWWLLLVLATPSGSSSPCRGSSLSSPAGCRC